MFDVRVTTNRTAGWFISCFFIVLKPMRKIVCDARFHMLANVIVKRIIKTCIRAFYAEITILTVIYTFALHDAGA